MIILQLSNCSVYDVYMRIICNRDHTELSTCIDYNLSFIQLVITSVGRFYKKYTFLLE